MSPLMEHNPKVGKGPHMAEDTIIPVHQTTRLSLKQADAKDKAPAANTAMRNCLVVSDSFPQPDQASGDLRFYTLLTLLSLKHQVLSCALAANGTAQQSSKGSVRLALIGIIPPPILYAAKYGYSGA